MDMISSKDVVGTTAFAVLFVLLACAVATDLSNRRIPNLLLVPALSVALMLHTMTGGVDGLVIAAGGLALGLAMLLPLYLIGGMSAGDVKLLGVVGSFLGPWGAVVAGLATMMAGGVFGLTVIVWQRLSPTHPVMDTRSLGHKHQVTHIPYAPAIAAGTLATFWYIGNLPVQFPG